MKVVIDIDDNLYTRLFDNGVDNYYDAENMVTAIRKGTVLPRGVGRLVSADAIYEQISKMIDSTPTIIKEDK